MLYMIIFNEVTKKFKSDFWNKEFLALDNASFEISESKIVGFLGANGAGKTTSLKILMDFIKPNSGEVVFDKRLGRNQSEVFSNIGYLPERPYFYPHLTGLELIEYTALLCDIPKQLIKERTDKWAKRFCIDFALNRKIRNYSKGMLQRLGFLTTLVHDPKIIILDEPLSGLDPIGRKEIKDTLVEVQSEGKTVFFSSHIISDVEEICEEVVFLDSGKVSFSGAIKNLVNDNINLNFQIRISGEFESLDIPFKELIKHRRDNSRLFQVTNDEKNKLIKTCVEQKINIVSVSQLRPSLEEIVYNLNK